MFRFSQSMGTGKKSIVLESVPKYRVAIEKRYPALV